MAAPARPAAPHGSVDPARSRRLAIAIAASAALVLSAPFIGYVRSWIRTQFPGRFVLIVGGLLALMGVVAIAAALARIRDRRAVRYAAIGAALGFAVWYSLARATGTPDVDVVERFHFVEYGLITFLFYEAWRSLADPSILILPVLAGLLAGTADEWLQWFIPNRVGEMADILLNGVAIGCGLLFSLGAHPPASFRTRLQPGSAERVGRLAAGVVVAFALFFHVVHLGYEVPDDEAGMFRSRYSKATLERLSREKAEEWRVRPLPLVLHRVSREDQYMTEGVTHVQERNKRAAANDAEAAWKENRILEKYFAPVLDTPSYVSRTGHRWSADQRADAQARAAKDGLAGMATPRYVSAANPYPIYAWPRLWFWTMAVALAAAVYVACAAAGRFASRA